MALASPGGGLGPESVRHLIGTYWRRAADLLAARWRAAWDRQRRGSAAWLLHGVPSTWDRPSAVNRKGSPAGRQWLGGKSDGLASDSDARFQDTVSLDPLAIVDYVPFPVAGCSAHGRTP